MAMPNALAYYDKATITCVKSFIVQFPEWNNAQLITIVKIRIPGLNGLAYFYRVSTMKK
jgi:hypothetical protein